MGRPSRVCGRGHWTLASSSTCAGRLRRPERPYGDHRRSQGQWTGVRLRMRPDVWARRPLSEVSRALRPVLTGAAAALLLATPAPASPGLLTPEHEAEHARQAAVAQAEHRRLAAMSPADRTRLERRIAAVEAQAAAVP